MNGGRIKNMKPASKTEKIFDSLMAASVTTAIAAASGGVLAALLPVLRSTLASGRHKARIEEAINELAERLSKIENFAESLTDAQYKLTCELVCEIFNTPDEEKINFLKNAALKTHSIETLNMHDATVLSRALNAISIRELTLLLECYGSGILFSRHQYKGFYNIDKFSLDGECAVGLINLGLLSRSSGEGSAGDIGAYSFTQLADKLVKLLADE